MDRDFVDGLGLPGDIRDGLGCPNHAVHYAVAMHALQDLQWHGLSFRDVRLAIGRGDERRQRWPSSSFEPARLIARRQLPQSNLAITPKDRCWASPLNDDRYLAAHVLGTSGPAESP